MTDVFCNGYFILSKCIFPKVFWDSDVKKKFYEYTWPCELGIFSVYKCICRISLTEMHKLKRLKLCVVLVPISVMMWLIFKCRFLASVKYPEKQISRYLCTLGIGDSIVMDMTLLGAWLKLSFGTRHSMTMGVQAKGSAALGQGQTVGAVAVGIACCNTGKGVKGKEWLAEAIMPLFWFTSWKELGGTRTEYTAKANEARKRCSFLKLKWRKH